MKNIQIRNILPSDNAALAVIIRNALTEFGANKPGTVCFDETTDHLYQLFQEEGSKYIVALLDDEIVGGAGIYPTQGLPGDTCELVKMYLKKEVRGTGLGRRLIEESLHFAKTYGYKNVYLETMPELNKAVSVYEKFGFQYLPGPLGNSGHFGCDVWMLKIL